MRVMVLPLAIRISPARLLFAPLHDKDNIMDVPTVRRLAVMIIVFLAGCGGPTHTSGTKGMAARELSVLSIPQLPKDAHVQIHTIKFDGAGDEYAIGKSRDFYLTPRDHTASFTLSANVPKVGGIPGFLLPKGDLTLPGPKNIPLGVLTAGKTYELVLPSDVDKMLQSGQVSLVREKGK